jgi:hypothetical protein
VNFQVISQNSGMAQGTSIWFGDYLRPIRGIIILFQTQSWVALLLGFSQ